MTDEGEGSDRWRSFGDEDKISVFPAVKAVILHHRPLHRVCAAGAFLMTSADQQHGC